LMHIYWSFSLVSELNISVFRGSSFLQSQGDTTHLRKDLLSAVSEKNDNMSVLYLQS
jgi:hypothetical protein